MDPEKQITRFFATWNTHDGAAMGAFYDPSAVMVDLTLPEPRKNRAAIVTYYKDMFAALENPFHDLLDWSWRNDRVWFEWTFGSGGAAKPREEYRGVSIQTFRDGLIVHDAAFWIPGNV